MQRAVKDIYVDPLIKQYIVSVVDATRKHGSVYLGASPRGSLALYRTCQARALLDGRDFVMPDDVKELAYATLGHRIIVSPAARVKNVTAKEVVEQTLERIPVPGARARQGAAPARRRDAPSQPAHSARARPCGACAPLPLALRHQPHADRRSCCWLVVRRDRASRRASG